MKQFVVAAILTLSLPAMANTDWRFFPQKTTQQKELLKLVKSGTGKQALIFWNSSLKGERFASTYTGKALYALMMFQAGLKVSGAEKLFALKAPKHVHHQVKSYWRETLSKEPQYLSMARVDLNKKWRTFLGAKVLTRLRASSVHPASSQSTLKKLPRLIQSKLTTPQEKDWLRWQLALAATYHNKNRLARNQMDRLLETSSGAVDFNHVYLNYARTAYQQKEYKEAAGWYNKIAKGSEYWLTSKEELAWSYLRQNQPNNTVASLETVLSPVFQSISSPEADFLSAYASLMICDYKRIFKVTKEFKKRHTQKILGLESLMKTNQSQLFLDFIEITDSKPIELASYGKLVSQLPRDFQLDQFLLRHLRYRQAMASELRLISQLGSGTSDLTFMQKNTPEADLSKLTSKLRERAEHSKKDAYKRLQHLAKIELKEYKKMIQKLHLVEAEVIQRLHLDENKLGKRKTIENPVEWSAEKLSFPVTDEVWLDEIDNYHAEVKDCPKLERAAL